MTRDLMIYYPILQRTQKGSLMDRSQKLLECKLNGRNLTINVGYEVINTSNRTRQVKANLIACMYRSSYLLSHQLTGIAVNTEHGFVGIDMESNLTILVDRYITLVAAIGLNTVDACGLCITVRSMTPVEEVPLASVATTLMWV